MDGEREFLGAADRGVIYTQGCRVKLGSRRGWITSMDHLGTDLRGDVRMLIVKEWEVWYG